MDERKHFMIDFVD